MSRRVLCLFLLSALISSACATRGRPDVRPTAIVTTEALLPAPAQMQVTEGKPFTVTSATTVAYDGGEEVAAIARYLATLIGTAVAPTRPEVRTITAGAPPSGQIVLRLEPGATGEGYRLRVDESAVLITASEPAGLFYGVQTLRQLMPWFIEYEAARADKARPLTIPSVDITDVPRYAWRGAMLDVARHFFTIDEVKRYIDLLAMMKMNRLHLHLSDDQGWRIEIKSWPNLTAIGSKTEVGGGPGGYYTQEQFADLVKYASAHFVTIVPEIDMPGHTNAALASYAELNCNGIAAAPYTDIKVGFSALCVDREVTYRFIDDVVREIAAMSPGPFFHVGGDEVKTLTAAQYAGFIERVQGIVTAHGKQMIGWDEVAATNLLPTSIVQHWRQKTTPRAAVERGAKVILSPSNRLYVDMKYDASTVIGLSWAALVEVRTAYDWDPDTLLVGVGAASIMGVEAPLWAETIANMREAEFLAFPRLAAVAEIGWSRRDDHNWDSFRARLGAQAPRWEALGINFYRSPQVPWRGAPQR